MLSTHNTCKIKKYNLYTYGFLGIHHVILHYQAYHIKGDIMGIPMISPWVVNEMTVLMSMSIVRCFNTQEQAVIGAFLTTLGTMISSNSVYILYNEELKKSPNTDSKDEYELLEKSIDELKEELKRMKENSKIKKTDTD